MSIAISICQSICKLAEGKERRTRLLLLLCMPRLSDQSLPTSTDQKLIIRSFCLSVSHICHILCFTFRTNTPSFLRIYDDPELTTLPPLLLLSLFHIFSVLNYDNCGLESLLQYHSTPPCQIINFMKQIITLVSPCLTVSPVYPLPFWRFNNCTVMVPLYSVHCTIIALLPVLSCLQSNLISALHPCQLRCSSLTINFFCPAR